MGKALGYVLLGGGLAASVAGIAILLRSRSSSELARAALPAGRSGMRLTHHRAKNLPIKARVRILQELTYRSVQDPEMRKLALKITKNCPARDDKCESKAIYDWMRAHIRYTGDIGPHRLGADGPVEGVDLFQTAARTVEFGGGDCDDHAILSCTLGLHNGLPCQYRVTSPTKSKKNDDYAHIYGMHGIPKTSNSPRFVAVDTTLPNGRYGLEAPYGKHLDFVA